MIITTNNNKYENKHYKKLKTIKFYGDIWYLLDCAIVEYVCFHILLLRKYLFAFLW